MPQKIIPISDDFWNIRGAFRIGGVVNIGTHVSLIRRASGGYIFLDSLTLKGAVKNQVLEATDNGRLVEAIVNVHPFHTVHVRAMHEMFPNADLFGTTRHHAREPDLPWRPERTEDAELHALFADDFAFSVPRGVDFVSENESIHFSSVLAYHFATKTIHSDDTFMCLRLPGPLSLVSGRAVSFHPTLSSALEKRAGAAADFANWAENLIDTWKDAENLCAAHNSTLTAETLKKNELHRLLKNALAKVRPTLRTHERKFG